MGHLPLSFCCGRVVVSVDCFFEYLLTSPVNASMSIGLYSSACLLAGRFDVLSVHLHFQNSLFSWLSFRLVLSLRFLASSSAFLDHSSFQVFIQSIPYFWSTSCTISCLISRVFVALFGLCLYSVRLELMLD